MYLNEVSSSSKGLIDKFERHLFEVTLAIFLRDAFDTFANVKEMMNKNWVAAESCGHEFLAHCFCTGWWRLLG